MNATALLESRRLALLRSAAAAEAVQRHLNTLSDGVARAARAVPAVSGWEGPAARAAGAHLILDTDRLARLATGFAAAAEAGGRHCGELRAAATVLTGGEPAQLARAEAIVTASSRRCAATLASLAASAPPRRSGIGEAVHRLSGWLGEVQFGAGEAALGLAGATITAATTPLSLSHRDGALDGGDLLGVLRHPGAPLAALLDERTWRQNPARAVGHLAPDAAAALLTGGASAAARAGTLSRLSASAARRSAAEQGNLLKFRGFLAAPARQRLVDAALDDGQRAALKRSAPGWRGAGGSHLDALQSAQADAMYRLGTAAEKSITGRMQQLADDVGGRLVGLEKRLKTPASYRRKLATRNGSWPSRLRGVDDLVRYTIVLDSPGYVTSANRVAAALTRDGLHLNRAYPAWNMPAEPYRGLNTVWQDVDTGRTFELQFHTPASRAAVKDARPFYEKERLASTSRAERAELRVAMHEIYDRAPLPPGIETITRDGGLIPEPPPAPFDPPPDLAVLHAVLAGGATAAATNIGTGAGRATGRVGP